MRPTHAVSAVVLVAILASCGNSKTDTMPIAGLVLGAAKQAITPKRNRSVAIAPVPLVRAEVEQYGIPILRAKVPSRGLDALLTIRETKAGVTTWTSTDGVTFTLRDGVLIQSRGLGADLMSASAPGPGAIAAFSTYSRAYFYAADQDRNDRRDYNCTPESRGAEAIVIVEHSHSTVHVAENCVRPEGRITNEFWLEDGQIRKSRQWLSPAIGYVDFERVVD